jgi:hypothetical protein
MENGNMDNSELTLEAIANVVNIIDTSANLLGTTINATNKIAKSVDRLFEKKKEKIEIGSHMKSPYIEKDIMCKTQENGIEL